MTYLTDFFWMCSDIFLMTRRNLLHHVRIPQLLVLSLVQPIIFLLLFLFVFGGAVKTPGMSYVNFIVPALFVQTMIFGSIQTGVGVAEDLSRGIMDRFRSLPMTRGAMLAGRAMADLLRNIFVVFLVGIVGYGMGFRFTEGYGNAFGALALTILFGFAFSWIAVSIGLLARNSEAAQAAGVILIFPLFFASSALVPVETMPKYLRWVAEYSPVTTTIDSLRILLSGGYLVPPLVYTIFWLFAIFIIFVPLSVWLYHRLP
ncbi:MAG TPA: ABC transporter permease [Candidatus Paceibacterota bacterium]|nr:ABC transporter permease [Candidatus Paceibacterota bacterium]